MTDEEREEAERLAEECADWINPLAVARHCYAAACEAQRNQADRYARACAVAVERWNAECARSQKLIEALFLYANPEVSTSAPAIAAIAEYEGQGK